MNESPHLIIGYRLKGVFECKCRRVGHPHLSLKVRGIKNLPFAWVECEGLTLVIHARIDKRSRQLKSFSKGCDMWYHSKVQS